MIDQPELNYRLAFSNRRDYLSGSPGDINVTKEDMLIRLLDELVKAWLETMTAVEIGSDLEKVRLLKEAQASVDGEPTPLLRQVYREVFLRDVWSKPGSDMCIGSRGTA